MTAATEIDWDKWRVDYDRMTFADQQEFYKLVAELHPHQQSFDPAAINEAFDVIKGHDMDVVELGGWDGRLASSMLGRDDILFWENVDLVEVPQVCSHPAYRLRVLKRPAWDDLLVGDVFVACHTIEHLKARELALLFDCIRADWIYLEAPLEQGGHDWKGYKGSHILEIGWEEIRDMLDVRGYSWAGGSYTSGLWGWA
jgi:hypothetical protein